MEATVERRSPKRTSLGRTEPRRYDQATSVPRPAELTSTRPSTLSGIAVARFKAIAPPPDMPTTEMRSMSSSSRSSSTNRVKNSRSYERVRPIGLGDSPWPGASGARTRNRVESWGITLDHSSADPPIPWRRMTGSPRPLSMSRHGSPLTSTVRDPLAWGLDASGTSMLTWLW